MRKLLMALLFLCGVANAQQQVINVGAGPNSGGGDPIRTWATKDNANFTQWYGVTGIVKSAGPSAAPVAATASDVATTVNGLLQPRTAPEITAGVTPTNLAWPAYDVRRYGAVNDCSADASGAIQNAINAAQEAGTQQHTVSVVLEPGACYLLNTGLTFKQGQSASDTHAYSVYLVGNNAMLKPAGGITAISIVPRCLLTDSGTGRGNSPVQIDNLVIDGGTAGATGARALLLGAAGLAMRPLDWARISHVTIQNFQATIQPVVHFLETSHYVLSNFVVRSGATTQVDAVTTGSFAGDLVFDGFEMGGAGNSTPRPLVIEAGVGGCTNCATRGVKFIGGSFYGSGAYVHVTGSTNQVGDVWFAGGMQFDSGNASAPFLELQAESSGQMFAVKSEGTYFDNASQAVYMHSEDGTGVVHDISFNSSHILQMTLLNANGLAAIDCKNFSGVQLIGNQFYINTGGASTAYIAASNCPDLAVIGNADTGGNTSIADGLLVSGSGSTNFVVQGNQFAGATTPIVYSSLSGGALYYDQLPPTMQANSATNVITLNEATSGNPSLIINNTQAASGRLELNAPVSGENATTLMTTAGVFRWQVGKSSGSESGSNVGSDYQVSAYSDGGSFLASPLLIHRNTGVVNIGTPYAGTGTSLGLASGLNLAETTVASLPATCAAGDLRAVSDATTPTYGGTLTGGSNVHALALCGPANTWKAH